MEEEVPGRLSWKSDVDEWRIGFDGWTVYVTGGLSWGDRPTELSQTFDLLEELEITDAAGFFERGNAIEIQVA